MKTFTRDLSFINFTDKDDNVYNDLAFVNFNGVTAFESWRQLIKSGVPPLTLTKCKSTDLVDYRIYGKGVGDKTKNLVRYPYYDTSKEQDGLKFTDNGDGSVTINGTATKNTIFSLKYRSSNNLYDVFPNETYTIALTGKGEMTGSMSFTANYYYSTGSSYSSWLSVNIGKTKTDVAPSDLVDLRVYLYCYANATFNNFTAYPQIVKGDTVGEWEPSEKYKIPVKVRGKNFIPYPYENTTMTNNGVTFTDNGDGTITANGTANSSGNSTFYCHLWSANALPAGTYIFRGNPLEGNVVDGKRIGQCTIALRKKGGTPVVNTGDYGNGQIFTIDGTDEMYITVRINSGMTANNLVFKPQIELDDISTDFESYVEPKITNIYLNEPLKENEYVSYKEDNLPTILLNKGTNVIDIDTTIKPSNLEIKYYGKGKLETLNVEDNTLLNSILSTDNETKIDIFDSEINNVLNEIIGG